MIDITKIKYRLVVMDEKGKQYNITELVQNLGWEENEGEISMRLSFQSRNQKTDSGRLSSLIKPGCLIGVFATAGTKDAEVGRGYIEVWNPIQSSADMNFKATAYDGLYKLQKSQDNRYISKGTGTKAAIKKILDDWKIIIGKYDGPNKTHGKMVKNNQYLSDIILELLDDAVKKGAKKCIIREKEGKAQIIPRGSNETVYVFRTDNTKSFSKLISTEALVTRVKVVGKENKAGQRKVEATVNGKTEYGIRQRIYTRGSDESLSDAKSAAKELLGEEGKLVREMTVQAPDVPFIRKGDLVYIISSLSEAYYYVNSIRHDADTRSMTMDLEKKPEEKSSGKKKTDKKEEKKDYAVGDTVTFNGGTHYVSSYKGSKGYKVKGTGKAKITKINNSGAHPYHLIHCDGKCNVYGWVDKGTFS